MDEEDDDFYDPVDTVPATQSQHPPQNETQEDNHMDDEEEVEEDDDVREPLEPMPSSIPV